jgi:hypothetical protein
MYASSTCKYKVCYYRHAYLLSTSPLACQPACQLVCWTACRPGSLSVYWLACQPVRLGPLICQPTCPGCGWCMNVNHGWCTPYALARQLANLPACQLAKSGGGGLVASAPCVSALRQRLASAPRVSEYIISIIVYSLIVYYACAVLPHMWIAL